MVNRHRSAGALSRYFGGVSPSFNDDDDDDGRRSSLRTTVGTEDTAKPGGKRTKSRFRCFSSSSSLLVVLVDAILHLSEREREGFSVDFFLSFFPKRYDFHVYTKSLLLRVYTHQSLSLSTKIEAQQQRLSCGSRRALILLETQKRPRVETHTYIITCVF